MRLSGWQRLKRRVSLLGGSYTHPDGYIELDFDAAAGIERNDSQADQDSKLARYHARQRQKQKTTGAMIIGAVIYLLAAQLGVPGWQAFGIGALFAYGLILYGRQ
jgi:hypothetical protein